MKWIQQHGNGAASGSRPARTPARVPDNCRVYAIGDIHGRADLLGRLHDQIEADAGTAPGARKILIYLGDYIDRGPEAFTVVDGLVHRPLAGFDIIHLKGNHEDFLLRFLDDAGLADIWLANGGGATLRSYGAGDGRAEAAEGEFLRRALAMRLPADHLAFYRKLRLSHVEGDYAFVHAGVRPGTLLAQQHDEDLMWIRHAFLESPDDFGKTIVHGHTVEREPAQHANRIGIDTGAYFTDCLTCLVLEGAARRFLRT